MTGEKNVSKFERWAPALWVMATVVFGCGGLYVKLDSHEKRLSSLETQQVETSKILADGKANRLALAQQVTDLSGQVGRQHAETMGAVSKLGEKLDRHMENPPPRSSIQPPDVAKTP